MVERIDGEFAPPSKQKLPDGVSPGEVEKVLGWKEREGHVRITALGVYQDRTTGGVSGTQDGDYEQAAALTREKIITVLRDR